MPLVTNLFGTARRAELAFGRRPARLVRRLVELARDARAADRGQAVGRARRGARGDAHRPLAPRERPGERGRDRRRAPRPAARAHLLARGRRTVRHAAARLHEHPGHAPIERERSPNLGRSPATACTSTTRARRACTGRSARAAASTTPSPRRAARALPVTVFLGGPPALDPRRDRAAAGERARADARVAHRRAAARARAPARESTRSSRTPRSRSSATCRRACASPRARSATTTATTRCATTTRSSASTDVCRRRDAIFPATVVGKPRQEDFFIGDLLQELLSPLFPLVMPGVVDLWSYGETGYHSLAAAVVQASATSARRWPPRSASSARASCR